MNTCRRCTRPLNSYNPTHLCEACCIEVRKEMALESDDPLYYGVRDIMRLLGHESEEYVRRLAREHALPEGFPAATGTGGQWKWPRQQVDLWMELTLRKSAVTTSPGQFLNVVPGTGVILNSGVVATVRNSGDVVRINGNAVVEKDDVPSLDRPKGE